MSKFIKKEMSEEDLKKLKIEDTIIVDVDESFSDIAIFLQYKEDTGEIVCMDGLFKGRPNIGTYYKCYQYVPGYMINDDLYLDMISRD